MSDIVAHSDVRAAPSPCGHTPKHGDVAFKSTVNASTALRQGQKAWAAVVVEIEDGYHAQSNTPLDENFIKFEIKTR